MKLFEAILDANHRAVAGDASAGLHPAEFADALPVVALTCIDPRLNALFPNALALPAEQFIWLRNAGNIITSPLSSTMRSLALACAVKGGREIAIIGHSDCQVCKTTTLVLLEKLRALGVDRSRLPDNVNEFFGMFGSERQNVIKACDFARNSPLIGPNTPVHGLLIDVETGKLEWLVNGYEVKPSLPLKDIQMRVTDMMESLGAFKEFAMGEMKFPEMKIGEAAAHVDSKLSQAAPQIGMKLAEKVAPMAASVESVAGQVTSFAEKNWPKPPLPARPSPLPPLKKPVKAPLPPPIRPRNLRRD
jgi:carbonic anhydrase